MSGPIDEMTLGGNAVFLHWMTGDDNLATMPTAKIFDLVCRLHFGSDLNKPWNQMVFAASWRGPP